jgi:AraC-like DNA-binding protein
MVATLQSALRQAEPPRWLLEHPLQLASPTARQVLWALGRRLTRNPDIGFVVAAGVAVESVGSLWPMYEAAPSLHTLSAHYDDWSALLLDFASYTTRDEGDLSWFSTRAPAGVVLDRAEQDFRTSMLVRCWRRLARSPALTPQIVHFAYPRPTSVAWHTRLLGDATLRFAQPCFQLGLARSVAHAQLPSAHAARFEALLAEARAAARAPRADTLAQRVEGLVTERLAHSLQEADVASLLGLSARSLRRKLARSGTQFRDLLARVRARERELYVQARVSTAETAHFLGFANRGALRNSLRRRI